MKWIKHFKDDKWGFTVFIMAENGNAFARAYWFKDDLETIYLDWLSVNEVNRKEGIGTELQLIRERIGVNNGATKSVLWVEKNTWQHEWYKRRGYVDLKPYEKEENAIWMEKLIG